MEIRQDQTSCLLHLCHLLLFVLITTNTPSSFPNIKTVVGTHSEIPLKMIGTLLSMTLSNYLTARVTLSQQKAFLLTHYPSHYLLCSSSLQPSTSILKRRIISKES